MAEERPLELISTKMLEILQTLVSAEHEDFRGWENRSLQAWNKLGKLKIDKFFVCFKFQQKITEHLHAEEKNLENRESGGDGGQIFGSKVKMKS